MFGITKAIKAFFLAHRAIRKLRLWRYFFIPVMLTILYFPLLIMFCYAIAIWLQGIDFNLAPSSEKFKLIFDFIKWTLSFIVVFVVGIFCYRGVVMVFYAPFLDQIVEAVERDYRGETTPAEQGMMAMIARVAGISLVTISLSVMLLVIGWLFIFVPILDIVISAILIPILELFLNGFGFIDPALERSGYGVRQSVKLMFRNFGYVTFFSLLNVLFTMIPIIGWFIGPTYGVVTGVIVGLQLQENR